jgi:hypothetical protein
MVFLTGMTGKAYSQTTIREQRYTVDTVVDGVHVGFSSIIRQFENNTRQKVFNPLTSYEANERRKQEEMQRINDEIDSARVEAFTSYIGLTREEGRKFWPVYNTYMAENKRILDKKSAAMQKLANPYLHLSEQEYANCVDDWVNSRDEEAKLMKLYKTKFSAILGAKKLPLLYGAEILFQRWMLQRFIY